MLFRFLASIIASFFIWICGALLNMDEPKIDLMVILSFHPFFYWFCTWPAIVFCANCKNHFALIVGRCTTLIYFALLVIVQFKDFFKAIASFPQQFFRIIHLTGGFGAVLFFGWGVCYFAIQYFIWIPTKSKFQKKNPAPLP